ncbi:MAG: hypothetical protein Fur0037_23310 [Planctomycetota bacterium]
MDLMKQAQSELSMDMTPMIDCVFLLMIFFVLVIDLSQQNLEDLILPEAKYQEPDDKPPENRPIINILQDGTIVYKNRVWYDRRRDKEDYSNIMKLLLHFKETIDLKMEPKHLGGHDVMLVNDPVLIRADKWTEWHFVGEVMKQCSLPQAAFWKLELAMSEQDKEKKLFGPN